MSGALHVAPMRPADLVALDVQPLQRLWMGPDFALDAEYGARLRETGPCWTVREGDAGGRPIAALGFAMQHAGYAVCWALLACNLGARHLPLTRLVRQRIEASGIRRLEALIRADHPHGGRWARCVGFRRGHLLAAAGPDGEDFWLYERVTREAGHGR